ncbi:hypothetical protein PR048_013074 [Dryococelus australis]|uniref:Uncharacterized protein n=1 Tax=Dryococelus australis TaxID=614101 RepID=A0ABQ9HR34_9NEOP|nr:hypothetical protein PR048_013074 [Dryococelus australis]
MPCLKDSKVENIPVCNQLVSSMLCMSRNIVLESYYWQSNNTTRRYLPSELGDKKKCSQYLGSCNPNLCVKYANPAQYLMTITILVLTLRQQTAVLLAILSRNKYAV